MKTANAKMHLKKLNNKPKQSGGETKLLTVTVYACLSTREINNHENPRAESLALRKKSTVILIELPCAFSVLFIV